MDIGFRVDMPDDVRRMLDLLHTTFRGMVDVVKTNEIDSLTITIYSDGTSRTCLEKGRYMYDKTSSPYNGTYLTSETKVRRTYGKTDKDSVRAESTEETV